MNWDRTGDLQLRSRSGSKLARDLDGGGQDKGATTDADYSTITSTLPVQKRAYSTLLLRVSISLQSRAILRPNLYVLSHVEWLILLDNDKIALTMDQNLP